MDEYHALAKQHRWEEIRSSGIAFLMLVLALFALYSNVLLLALVPLAWIAYKVGKEMGRGEAQREMERTAEVSRLIRFPDQP
ncbi:hypothetical protein SVA_1377 [Sulfurifustis variabilis]|uniref:Uncharacterized protein n=1 Tax=Sulfurifustis variabilis TaxID=1675686 RepID=A0A1B4V5T8_9GAMM|nr:hypothetical protein [Sulfurifustis variabilis]BAU47942.1 hypothetical protein SVA_1377 [Sulfurifustis variabilis]